MVFTIVDGSKRKAVLLTTWIEDDNNYIVFLCFDLSSSSRYYRSGDREVAVSAVALAVFIPFEFEPVPKSFILL